MAVRASALSGILGALLGDAIGVPYEFKRPEDLPALELIGPTVPAGYPRSHSGVAPGIWSDDGAQTLCVLESLLTQDGFDPQHLAQLLVAWRINGRHQVGGRVFDVGLQTDRAIMSISRGGSLLNSGGKDAASNGNGALMRNLPVAVFGYMKKLDPSRIAGIAMEQSRLTHAHPLSMVTCALHALTCVNLLEGEKLNEAISQAAQSLRSLLRDHDAEALVKILTWPQERFSRGSGFVVDSFWSVIQCARQPGYVAAVRATVMMGNDTDTTACIACGIAGILYNDIPNDWLSALEIPEESQVVINDLGGQQPHRHRTRI